MSNGEFLDSFQIQLITSILILIITFFAGYSLKLIFQYFLKSRPFFKIWSFSRDPFRFKRIYKFWKKKKPLKVYIVTGSVPRSPEKPTPMLASGDVYALVEIINSLYSEFRENIELRTYYSKDFPTQNIGENIICMGGPKWNPTARKLLKEMDSKYSFDANGNLVVKGKTKPYSPKKENGKYVTDYGVVIKAQNPYASRNTLFMLFGCHTYGVLAAAKSLSSLDDFGLENIFNITKKFKKEEKYFDYIVETKVLEDFVKPQKIIVPEAQG